MFFFATKNPFPCPLMSPVRRNNQKFFGAFFQKSTASFLLLITCGAAYAQNSPVTVAIDANASQHPISPQIYGVAFASQADLTALNAPLNRSGGNNMSTYSYRENAQNLDADYYFESYPQQSAVKGAEADSFVADTQAAGAQPMLTIPMVGWVAILGPDRSILPSFSVAKYGAQCSTDPYDPVE